MNTKYLEFIKRNNIKNLTTTESQFLQSLVDNDKRIGGFEKILKLYRESEK